MATPSPHQGRSAAVPPLMDWGALQIALATGTQNLGCSSWNSGGIRGKGTGGSLGDQEVGSREACPTVWGQLAGFPEALRPSFLFLDWDGSAGIFRNTTFCFQLQVRHSSPAHGVYAAFQEDYIIPGPRYQ